MKIKLFENYDYDSFKTTITQQHIDYGLDLQERISTLAFMIYKKDNGEEFDEDGTVDWTNTFFYDDPVQVVLQNYNLSEDRSAKIDVPKHLIFHPEDFEEYFDSKRFGL